MVWIAQSPLFFRKPNSGLTWHAMTDTEFSNGYWTVPSGVTQIIGARAMGKGAPGNQYTNRNGTNIRLGGGGGALSIVTTPFAVTPGEQLNIQGSGSLSACSMYRLTQYIDYNGDYAYTATTFLLAEGGGVGNNTGTGATLGGRASQGVGDVTYSGGNGNTDGSSGYTTGCGGGAAGSTGDGGNYTTDSGTPGIVGTGSGLVASDGVTYIGSDGGGYGSPAPGFGGGGGTHLQAGGKQFLIVGY